MTKTKQTKVNCTCSHNSDEFLMSQVDESVGALVAPGLLSL